MLASRISGALANCVSRKAIGGLDRAAVQPGEQAEGEHVLRPGGVLAGQAELLDRLDGHAGQVDRVQRVVGQRAVLERVGGVADLGQVAAVKSWVSTISDAARRQVGAGWPSAPPGSSRPARRGGRRGSGCRGRRSAAGRTRRRAACPAGARISAGKFGSVERSLPKAAVSWVNRSPVSCMPSPESPAKRMITRSSCLTCLATWLSSFVDLGRRAPSSFAYRWYGSMYTTNSNRFYTRFPGPSMRCRDGAQHKERR